MTQLPEIHPCICGQTAGDLLNWVHPVHTKGYLVACTRCGRAGHLVACTRCGRAGHLGATKAQAIERWNAATDPDTTDAPGPHFEDFPFRFDAMEVTPQ